MRVGIWTTWNQRCGIAAYSENLAKGFLSYGVNVSIIGNVPYDPVPPEGCTLREGITVNHCFSVPHADPSFRMFDEEEILLTTSVCDGLIIQFEAAIHWKDEFLAVLPKLGIPIILTLHSSCYWPDLLGAMPKGTEVLVHRTALEGAGTFYPFPSPLCKKGYTKPKEPPRAGSDILVRSFGLGRNKDELAQVICNGLGRKTTYRDQKVRYETHYAHDGWLSQDELLRWLEEADFILLYYPPMDPTFSSSAAAVAAGTGVPVITSETNCFDDYPFVTRGLNPYITAERMFRLVEDPDEYMKTSFAGMAYSILFNFQSLAVSLLQTLAEMRGV